MYFHATWIDFILAGEIGRDLQPRLEQSGAQKLWDEFTQYIASKALSNGSNLIGLIKGDATWHRAWKYPAEFLMLQPLA